MNVLEDGWTPFFDELIEKVNADGRRLLLSQLIGDVYDVTVLNLGPEGIARPEEWAELSRRYAEEHHYGNTTPTLILTGALKSGFEIQLGDTSATLSNKVPYSELHQFGEGYLHLPARPFYPVDSTGETFTTFMVDRLAAIVEQHFQLRRF